MPGFEAEMGPGQGEGGVLGLNQITVRRIMMPSNVTVPPDFSLAEVLAVLHRRRLKAVSVVDGSGRMMGIVTLGQIDRLLAVTARQRDKEQGRRGGGHCMLPCRR